MKKTPLLIVILCCLALGAFLEQQFDLFTTDNASLTPTTKKYTWDKSFQRVEIESPIDGHQQAAYFYPTSSSKPQALVVSLHTWSNDYTQFDSLNLFALKRDVNYIHPNFRGPNNHPNACCSELVISDIDAAIDYAIKHANVDRDKIFVLGKSGGGYATLAMFMKSRHKIAKFSSWVPLSDLVQWYEDAKIRKLKYAGEVLKCTSSEDGKLNVEQAKSKSPIFWDTPIEKLNQAQLDIYTGVYDGMMGNGVIPITHSYNFYNKVLSDLNVTDSSKYVSDEEKLALLEHRKPLGQYGRMGGRDVVLIKETNNVTLTFFIGGHEMLRKFAFEQLFL